MARRGIAGLMVATATLIVVAVGCSQTSTQECHNSYDTLGRFTGVACTQTTTDPEWVKWAKQNPFVAFAIGAAAVSFAYGVWEDSEKKKKKEAAEKAAKAKADRERADRERAEREKAERERQLAAKKPPEVPPMSPPPSGNGNRPGPAGGGNGQTTAGPRPSAVVLMAAASLKRGDAVYLDGTIRTVTSMTIGEAGWAVTVNHDGGRHRFSDPHDMVQLAVGVS